MMKNPEGQFTDEWILAKRGRKNEVDPLKPYAWLVEKECTPSGNIEDTAIIFLTNRECQYHCLMCDLWKNTTDFPVPAGSIPQQIQFALNRMAPARHLKLYNSGSFFDERAISSADYEMIADLVSGFETVIVESHPRLVNEKCLRLRDMLKPELQVAMGLETVHPEILRKLNKRMTLEDFENTVKFLSRHDIRSRAFILLRPPFLSETEGVHWANRSLEFSFGAGVECCTVIPVRAGNGAMDALLETGDFIPPHIKSLESVLEYGIGLRAGRVFADTWDLEQFADCSECFDQRRDRLIYMNLHQREIAPVTCSCGSSC